MAKANTFAEKAVKFQPILDEIYQKESVTAILEDNKAEFDGTKTVKYPKIDMEGLGDYDRVNGYADGAINVEYESHVIEYDRGRKFRIDVLDDDESAFNLYREAQVQFTRTKEIPEMDAIRMARLAENAGKVEEEDLSANTALEAYDKAEQYMTDNEVTDNERLLFVSGEYYRFLKQSGKITRSLDVNKNNGVINRNVYELDDGTTVIKVPQKRFYDVIELLDGKSTDEATGGYRPIDGISKEINFIYMAKKAGKAITKRRAPKVIEPDTNQSADAYDVAIRLHHDLIVKDNQKVAIYVSKKTKAINEETPSV